MVAYLVVLPDVQPEGRARKAGQEGREGFRLAAGDERQGAERRRPFAADRATGEDGAQLAA